MDAPAPPNPPRSLDTIAKEVTQEVTSAVPEQLLLSQPVTVETPLYDINRTREETRGDLARSILWLLAFVIGGVILFVGTGQLEASTLVQSIFPSLVTLAGTALGFYF